MKVQERILNLDSNNQIKNRKKGSNRKMESDSSSEVITHIEIQKEIDTIHVIIHIGFPNLLKKKGAIEELEKDLQKEVNSVNQRLNIAIEKVKEPYRQPNILAEYIAFQLTNRGIKIQIAGLLGVKIWIFNLKSFNIIAMLSHQYNKILKKKREFEISKSKKPKLFLLYIDVYALQVEILYEMSGVSETRYRTPKRNIEDKKPLWSSKIDVIQSDDGIIIRYDDNAAVIIDQKGNPKGTRVFGAVAEELRELNLTKIVSLAPEVL
ncbi:hypothetical protein ACJX0J_003714 [Zea mays]